MSESKGALCQSCGMPLVNDTEGGGTNVDGSRSSDYCSKCFMDGRFVWKDATPRLMQQFCVGKLVEMGYPGFVAKLMTANIPKLKRWRR